MHYARSSQRLAPSAKPFFANQLALAGHTVEYAGYKSGDFRIDGNTVVEVGGENRDSLIAKRKFFDKRRTFELKILR